jgi:PAS domain-containing protein
VSAVETNKLKSQLLIASEQAQNTLMGLEKSLTDKVRKLQELIRARWSDLRKLLEGSADAIGETSGKISKFKSQLFIVPEPVMEVLRRVQNMLTGLETGLTDKLRKLREAIFEVGNDLRKLLTRSLEAVALLTGKIGKFRSQVFIASGHALQRAQDTITGLGKSVADKPRKLQKSLRARENDLRRLLASSIDAIVVTDADHRLVAANSKALDLLGVSEANLSKFTIDAFLSFGQVPYFDGNGSPFPGREKRQGECKIRRLDGSLRAAEYVFVANFVPYRHLCKFHNVKTNQVKFISTFSYGHGNDSNKGELRGRRSDFQGPADLRLLL